MKTIIWGSRGSLPASVRAETQRRKIFEAINIARVQQLYDEEEVDCFIDNFLPFWIRGSYGTNTSCVEVRDQGESIIFDAGTGLRDYGNYLIQSGIGKKNHHIILSHLHWDHIQGFPFFIPAYIPGNSINIYGCHSNLEQAFKDQQNPTCFPVALHQMPTEKNFIRIDAEREYGIEGFAVTAIEQNHPGKSYGYCIEKNGKKIIYSSDSEHKNDIDDDDYPFLDFIDGADLLIFDAQYSFIDNIYSKENWGHSNGITGVELAVRAGVKHLCMFHSEPTCDDEKLDEMLQHAINYALYYAPSYSLKISMAYDGLEIEI